MQPHEFKHMTHIYTSDECGDLPVMRDDDLEVCASCWRPSADELAMLNAGASVVLIVSGEQPPVTVEVTHAAI